MLCAVFILLFDKAFMNDVFPTEKERKIYYNLESCYVFVSRNMWFYIIPFSPPQTRMEIVDVVEIFCFLFISIAKYFLKIKKN